MIFSLKRSAVFVLWWSVIFRLVQPFESARAQTPDSLNLGLNGAVLALAPQPDGGLLLGGNFTGARNGLARYEVNSVLDNSFNPGVNNATTTGVATLNLRPNGAILVGGNFTNLSSLPRHRLARLNFSGLGELDFNLGANSNVLALVTQPDGKVLVAGNFTNLAGQARAYLGRLNTNGTLDEAFAPALNGPVQTLWVQNDNMILLGGEFTSVAGVTRNYLARLDADGNLDGSFDPGADGPVYCFALQADGRILVGGNFGMMAGQPRLRLARLEPTGSLDLTFAPEADGEIRSLTLQADGKIFVGGSFTNFNGVVRSNLVRLETTGGLDGYIPNPNASVVSLGLQADGKLLVGGNFTAIGGINRARFARLTNDLPAAQSLTLSGSTLTWLRSGSCPEVWRAEFAYSTNRLDWITLPAPERIAGGWALTAVTIPAGATLRARGEVRGGYNNNSTWWIEFSTGPLAISFPPQDQVALVGVESQFRVTAAGDGPFYYRWYRSNLLVFSSPYPYYKVPLASPGVMQFEVAVSNGVSTVTNRPASFWTPGADAFNGGLNTSINVGLPQPDGSLIAGGAGGTVYRFNPNGAIDTTFSATGNGAVNCLAAQPEGKTLVAGAFTTLAGLTRNRVALLDAFGRPDPNFNPNVSGTVNTLLVQADGKILIGGAFLNVGGVSHPYLARLNADGTPDNSFNPFANGAVYSLAIQSDGMILVGGGFTLMNGMSRQRLARLFPDGSLDPTFNPGSVGTAIYALLVQPDEKILVAGNFTSLAGQLRSRIGRLLSSGAIDGGFNPGINNDVLTLQLQVDGKIWVGGIFSMVAGQTRNGLARLNPDGTLDPTIGANSSANPVYGLALQGDGKLLAGGNFTSLYGATRSRFGRVLNNSAASQSLTTDGNSVTWQRSGSGPEIERARFDYSTNGTDWIELPEPVRIPGGWESTGVNMPSGVTLRARGYLNGGFNNGSSYCIEASSGPPLIQISPTDLTLVPISTERLAVTTYGGGGGPFTFQWYQNGVLQANGTNSWFNILGLVAVNVYEVVVTTPSGTIRSQPLPFWGTGADALNPNANGTVYAIALQPDRKILVGGTFTNSPGNRLARLLPHGARDTGFTPTVSGGVVYALAVQTNGQILVGGSFTNLNGQTRNGLARLNADGSLDSTFNPSLSSFFGAIVQCLAIQPDGRILVGGWFQSLAGQSRYCLGRLNHDGSLDSGFVPPSGHFSGAEAGINSIILAPNGDVLVFGEMREAPTFTTYAQRLDASGNRLFRIFYYSAASPPPAPRYLTSAARQPDGGIIMGGFFDWIENGQLYRNIARIDANGFLDASFTNIANNFVTALAVQADGKTLVGGSFTSIGGQSRNGLARLNADGTVDAAFTLQASGSAWVHSLAIQPDGRSLVGGSFTNLAGFTRNNIGRLLGPEYAIESLHWDGSNLIWQRSAVSPEVGPTILETSPDGVNWNYHGEGVRVPEGWQWVGVTIPPDAVLRTRGFVGGGESFWHAESILPTSPRVAPTILTSSGSLNFGPQGFGFYVAGNLGHLAVIEASTNLTQWTAIQTNRLLPPPTFFNDTSATNLSRRFYRARLP